MINDDNLANTPSERTNQLIRLTMIPAVKTLLRRQKILLTWLIGLALMNIVNFAMVVVTLGEVIR
jgi:hypothetical protein